jgi:DNA-binding CsgD family transcriptional regulator
MGCTYCWLIYGAEFVALEAIVAAPEQASLEQKDWVRSSFKTLFFIVSCLGGVLKTQTGANQRVIQVLLKLPYPSSTLGPRLRIQCRLPVLQMAFTHLAHSAGLTVCEPTNEEIPLLTDDIDQIQAAKLVLWLQLSVQVLPKGVNAKINLSISPMQLREAVEAVIRGESWGIESGTRSQPLLSEREQEIMALLAQGLRDRDIANQLFISESTVKFHINNILAKLKARTRYQALHQVIINGWIH